MFSEILNIKPKLDNGDLRKMEKSLTTRFANIGKKFSKGIGSALLGGGLAGLGLGFLEKLLNPLKEVQESIDKTLKTYGDIADNAEQFGTTAGKLLKLQAFAQAKGLEAGDLYMLIGKYQTAIAEAKNDPTKSTSVRNFVDIKDTAEGFFEFIQAVRKLTPEKQIAVQQEVFGEKQILKMSAFLKQDMAQLSAQLNLPGSENMTPILMKGDAMGDLTDALGAQRFVNDLLTKGQLINRGMVNSRDASLQQEQARENARLANYNSLAKLDRQATAITAWFEQQGMQLLKEVQKIASNGVSIQELLGKISLSRLLKGVGGGDK